MKKLISLFAIAAVLVAAVFMALPAYGEQTGSAHFTLSDVNDVAPGESFAVTLHISGDYQAHGMNLSIMYDPNSMVLEHTEVGQYLSTVASSGNLVQIDDVTMLDSGMIKIGVICPINAVSGEGDMLILHFHVKDGVTVNQQVLLSVDELIYLPLGSMTSEKIPFTTENAVITLRGGSAPGGGYNEGGEEPIPTSPYSTVEPGTQPTPEPMTTPDISDITGTAAPATTVPATDEPATAKPNEPVKVDDTENPAGAQEGADATAAPEKAAESNNVKKVVLWCVAGALALAGGAAAVLIVTGKKNGGNKKRK